MEPSQAAGEDEEEAGGDSEEKSVRSGASASAGAGAANPPTKLGSRMARVRRISMPLPAMKAARRKRRMRPARDEDAAQPVLSEGAASRNGGESDQEFRRNRRRGRRGGRRHRDEMAGGAEFAKPEGGAIPGLGEQPVLGFDLHFPRNAVLEPVSREPAAQELPSAPQPAAEAPAEAAPEPVLAAAVEAVPQPEKPANAPAAGLSEAAPEPAFELAPAPEAPAAAPAPVQKPKPKPVKAGPARKGWWQRRTG